MGVLALELVGEDLGHKYQGIFIRLEVQNDRANFVSALEPNRVPATQSASATMKFCISIAALAAAHSVLGAVARRQEDYQGEQHTLQVIIRPISLTTCDRYPSQD